MPVTRRLLLGGASVLAAAPVAAARVQGAPPVLRLGVLTDLSGPYRDTSGSNSVACVRQAVQEAQAALPSLKVEVLQADHQNKADVGATVARRWFDRDGVDAVVDVPNSAVALAVAEVAREKDKVCLASGAATTDLTGPRCSPNTIHWGFDSYMLARSLGGALTRAGRDSWFFLVADYALGHALQRDATALIEAAGGRVAGAVRYPFPQTTDFSSFLLQAQATGAKVLGLANAGGDTTNAIKQAAEFGLMRRGERGMTIGAMLMFISDVHALGLRAAQGLVLTESFYWNLDDRTRAFTRRVQPVLGTDTRPNMDHAACYAASLHYLKAAADLGAAEAKRSGAATVSRMKAMPADDDAFGAGRIRDDGRKLHPAHLFEVKSPEESRGAWDYYKPLATTPAEDAARPLAQGGCFLVRA